MPKSNPPKKGKDNQKNKPYTRSQKSPGKKKKEKGQQWVDFLNELDQKYKPSNPIQDPVQRPLQEPIQEPVIESVISEVPVVQPPKGNLNLEVQEEDDQDYDSEDYHSSQDEDFDPALASNTSSSCTSSSGVPTNEIEPLDIDVFEMGEIDEDELDLSPKEEAFAAQVTGLIVNAIVGTLENALDDPDADDMDQDYSSSSNSSNQQSPDRDNQILPRKRRSEDIQIVLGSPSKRRKLGEKDKEYKSIINYQEKDLMGHFMDLSDEDKNRIIKEERYIKDNFHNDEPLRLRIINSNLPAQIKAEILKKMASSKSLFGSNNKMLSWINHVMRVPWNILTPTPVSFSDPAEKIAEYMGQIYNRMDQAVYGHAEAKCHILQIVGKWITNPKAVGNCLALQGPMGVGKTTLVKEGLAPALGRPFNFISLGGATDSSFLQGHSYTYEGSIPGQIVEVIQRSGCMNPIIYFDELDKISKSHKGDEIANILVHLTDSQQNDCFHDKYFGNINIDLSKAFFVFSYNDDNNISPILRDRLQVIRIKGYKIDEKVNIAQQYMIPRFAQELGFEPNQIQISDEIIRNIAFRYTEPEEGVRNLGRSLETLLSRLNVIRLIQGSQNQDKAPFLKKLPFRGDLIPPITNPFAVTKKIVDNILDCRKQDDAWRNMYV